MPLATSYLTSTKNTEKILKAIQGAQAPPAFTVKFLESLGFKSTSDRLIIGVLKALGFLTAGGTPTQRYFAYLDEGNSKSVLAEGIREAYGDLFQVNKDAQVMSQTEVRNKLKTLTQGKASDTVVTRMAATFVTLAKLADWSRANKAQDKVAPPADEKADAKVTEKETGRHRAISHLSYQINLILPESRDPGVYDVLFKSLKEHLLS